MLFLVLASAFLVAVRGEIDPTTICFPDVVQVDIASLTRAITGILVANFPNKEVAYRYSDGTRHVVNLADNSVSIINETDGSCQRITSEFIKDLNNQCFPASTKVETETDVYLGLNPGGLQIIGLVQDLPNIGTLRIGVTKSSPNVPVIAQVIASNPVYSDIQIFINPQTTIDDPTIFNVPDVCPPPTSVG